MKTKKALICGLVLAVVVMEVGFVAAQMRRQMKRDPMGSTAIIQKAAAGAGAATSTDAATIKDAASEDAAIRQVMIQQATAWNAGNIETFMQAYKNAPDTAFIGAKVRQGYQPILENYQKNYSSKQKMGTLTFSELNVRLLDARYAIVTGRFHLSRTRADKGAKNDGVFSLVWEKTSSGWKIILDHTS